MVLPMVPTVLAWESERPSNHVSISQRTENAATDGKASVGLGVNVVGYRENWGDWPSDGDDDIVDLRISTTANTRRIVSYWVSTDTYSWHDNLPYSISLGDNEGSWVWMRGIKARFYGGPRSGEYTQVWVSRNGFIGFDPNSAPTDAYYSRSIPNTAGPNTFVAPFWRDLKPGGSITYGTVWHWPGFGPYIECFAISWNNVPDRSGQLQTFQVIIENAPTRDKKIFQSRIWFQYKSVTLNDQTTVGIEDQQGAKGTSYTYQSLSNGMTLLFDQSSDSALVGNLKIILSENDAYASTEIDRTASSIRGYNVILDQNLPDDQEQYYIALDGAQTLLFTALDLATASSYVTGAGFIIDAFLITVDWARYMARQQAIARLLEIDSVHAKAQGTEDTDGIFVSEAVDSSFDTLAYWLLNDANNQDHTLTVSADLTYVEYNAYGTVVATTTISTSTDLRFTHDDNDNPSVAGFVQPNVNYRFFIGNNDRRDYYKIGPVLRGWIIQVTAEAVSEPGTYVRAEFSLHLYDPSVTQKTWTEDGYSETVSYTADSDGIWFVEVRWSANYGFYNLMPTIYIPPPPPPGGGGGGGCVVKGTLVTMADGTSRPVENIKLGDEVLGFDPSAGAFMVEHVLNVTSTQVRLIENINNGALRLTPTNQPIYIRNSTYTGWIKNPSEMRIGWQILDVMGDNWVTVTSIFYETRKTFVYDFITDGYRTYLANSYLLMDKGYPK
jgi:hypothetical protein